MDDTAKKCIDIIAASKNIPVDSITLDSSFDELVIDSLDKINISFEVEDTFAIEIPDDSLGSLKTVGDMVRGVEQLQQQKSLKASEAAPAEKAEKLVSQGTE